MPNLLLINPQARPALRKGKTKMATKRRRTPARKAPARRTYRAASKTVTVMAPTPARRRRSPSRALAAVKRKVGRYKRNPAPRAGVMGLIMPAMQGAAGSLVVNTALNYLPIPAGMKTGPMLHVVRLAGAFAVGMAAHKLLSREAGKNMALGALTVAMHDLAVSVGQKAGFNRLGAVDTGTYGANEFGQLISADNSIGAMLEDNSGMGEYVSAIDTDVSETAFGEYVSGDF